MVDNDSTKKDVLKFSNPTVAFGFTQERIKKLKPRGKTYSVRDTESGMYCYVSPTDSKIYKTYKKFQGSPQRITIGDANSWSIKDARKQHPILFVKTIINFIRFTFHSDILVRHSLQEISSTTIKIVAIFLLPVSRLLYFNDKIRLKLSSND